MRKLKLTPEQERKLKMISSGILCVLLVSVALYGFFMDLYLMKTTAKYVNEQASDIRAAAALEYPINDTTVALEQSELAFVVALAYPSLLVLTGLPWVLLAFSVFYFRGFYNAWRKIVPLEERVKRLEARRE